MSGGNYRPGSTFSRSPVELTHIWQSVHRYRQQLATVRSDRTLSVHGVSEICLTGRGNGETEQCQWVGGMTRRWPRRPVDGVS